LPHDCPTIAPRSRKDLIINAKNPLAAVWYPAFPRRISG